MKRLSVMLLALLLLTGSAMADVDLSQYSVTNASVQAMNYVDVTAPCAGTLKPFTIQTGDAAAAGEVLFSMLTTDVFAAEDGQVTAMFVDKGDDAAAAMKRFGSLGAMDPEVSQLLICTTMNAYDSDDAKVQHVGETLYFKSWKTNGDKGTGRVIAVTAEGFTVEIQTGKFSVGESMRVYRDSNCANRDCIGTGTVTQRMPLTFTASGLVTDVYVSAGDRVKAGDLIMTVLPGVDDRRVTPDITAPNAGVVGTIAANPGQQVWKGALLCRVYLTDELEIVAEVDEMDLKGLDVGSVVYVTVDTAKNNVISAQISEISSLGVSRGNAAYYTVHVSLPRNKDLMLGQSASLYLPKN